MPQMMRGAFNLALHEYLEHEGPCSAFAPRRLAVLRFALDALDRMPSCRVPLRRRFMLFLKASRMGQR